jgi:hypothetical protein
LRPAKIQAARAGVMVMALTAEMIIAAEMVRANWRKNWPVMPPRKAPGSSTELRTSVMARIGPVISFMARIVASRTGRPFSSQRSMFSSTTMESSTTMPMASTSPSKVRLLREKPKRWMIAKVPTSDTATSMTGKSNDFQSCRKSRTTMATRITASRSVSNTALTDSWMNGVVS